MYSNIADSGPEYSTWIIIGVVVIAAIAGAFVFAKSKRALKRKFKDATGTFAGAVAKQALLMEEMVKEPPQSSVRAIVQKMSAP